MKDAKKKAKPAKLRISKETLRTLSGAELQQVAGGLATHACTTSIYNAVASANCKA